MTERRVAFPCGSRTLEGMLHEPGGSSLGAVVVCHPHPLYGGDMGNNVVLAVCRALVQHSITALRFNFRGVGRSQSGYSGGHGEQEDVRATLDFLGAQKGVAPQWLGLVGYSFGAMVMLPVAAAEARVYGAVAISLPLDPPGLEPWREYRQPKLLINGGRDEYIPASEFERLVAELPDPKEYAVIPGADHFWWGHEAEVASKTADFFARLLGAEKGPAS